MADGQRHIDEVYAFVVMDPTDNTEGIPAIPGPGNVIMPMTGADWDRVKSLLPIAQAMRNGGMEIKLVRFTNREEVPF